MIEFRDAKAVAHLLAAVAEPTRLLILHRLVRRPHFVGELAKALGAPMVNVSHHLGVMRQAGLLDDAKDGRRVVYTLRPEVFSADAPPGALGVLTFGPVRLVLLGAPTANADGVAKTRGKKPRGAAERV